MREEPVRRAAPFVPAFAVSAGVDLPAPVVLSVPVVAAVSLAGEAAAVLGRLTDGAYDLVVVDADKESYPVYVEEAIRLLRPGGVLALDNMLWHDKVADPAARDETTTLLRDLGKQLRDDERLFPALIPAGDGLLVAVRR